MKHHNSRNKALLEKLTKQYSKGEVEEGLWDTLKKGGRKIADLAKEKEVDPMSDPIYRDLVKTLDRIDKADARNKFQAEKAVEDVMAAKKKEISSAANDILVLLNKVGIPQDNDIYKNLSTSMQDAVKALDADVQRADFDWPEPEPDYNPEADEEKKQ